MPNRHLDRSARRSTERRRPDPRPPLVLPRLARAQAASDEPRLPCAHYPACVGCPLIGRPYGEQLEAKRATVVQALARHPTLAGFEVPEVIGSPRAFGYRNQVKLVVRKARRGRLIGVYRPGTHQIVDIRECPVHHPLINSVLAELAPLLDRFDIEAYDERIGRGVLRYVLIRVAVWSKAAQVVLVTTTKTLPHERDLVGAIRRIGGVVSVVHNINPEPGNVILADEYRSLTKQDTLLEKINGLKLFTHAGAFLQANTNIAGRIYRQAAEWAALTDQDTALDLYCGAGALAFHLAPTARLVIGIEESAIAVADAKVNVRMNGFHNVRFRCGDAGELLAELSAELERIDVVAVNPPRKGLSERVRTTLLAAAPRRVVYVSCDPVTLARDLDHLSAAGSYQLTALQPYDMLPQTEHVETLALLARD